MVKILSPLTGQAGISEVPEGICSWCSFPQRWLCPTAIERLSCQCCACMGQQLQPPGWNLKAGIPNVSWLHHLASLLCPPPLLPGVRCHIEKSSCEQLWIGTESAPGKWAPVSRLW